MPRAQSKYGDTLASWLEENGLQDSAAEADQPASPGTIKDKALVRSLLIAAAREGRSVSYSEMLNALGHRFTRPKMRSLCKTLDAIDEDARAAAEPAFAVLVVRESDRLPGQGWWTHNAERLSYKGAWEGAEAMELITAEQDKAFAYWRERSA